MLPRGEAELVQVRHALSSASNPQPYTALQSDSLERGSSSAEEVESAFGVPRRRRGMLETKFGF